MTSRSGRLNDSRNVDGLCADHPAPATEPPRLPDGSRDTLIHALCERLLGRDLSRSGAMLAGIGAGAVKIWSRESRPGVTGEPDPLNHIQNQEGRQSGHCDSSAREAKVFRQPCRTLPG